MTNAHISLRLRQHAQLVAQQDDRIISPWFAQDTVEPGLDFWSLHELYIPEGLQPDQYELWAVVYELGGPELPMDTGGVEINLGTLKVVPQFDRLQHTLPITTLAPCLELISVSPDGATALIGSNFGLHFLWEAHCQPAVDIGLRFFLEDGASTHELGFSPFDAVYPPNLWKPGQRVLTKSVLRLPADLLSGPATLTMGAVDLTNGQPFGRRWGLLPLLGDTEIANLSLVTRPHIMVAPDLDKLADTSFGGQIRLLRYEVATNSITTSSALTVTLAWQAERAMDVSYKVFLHLLDDEGLIVAQSDAVPSDGQLPTNIWLPGEVVIDRYVLRPEQPLEQGAYTLITGLYDSSSGQRLPVFGAPEGSSTDFIQLDLIPHPPD